MAAIPSPKVYLSRYITTEVDTPLPDRHITGQLYAGAAGGLTMTTRELKALEIAARMRLSYSDGAWTVPSQSGQGPYRVRFTPSADTCTCDDWATRRQDCKHILACRRAG